MSNIKDNNNLRTIRNCFEKIRDCFGKLWNKMQIKQKIHDNCCPIVLLLLFILFLSLIIIPLLFILKTPISVEPQKFEVKIPAGDSITQTISIKNLGISDVHISNISIVPELIEKWVNTTRKDFTINSKETENINFSFNIHPQTLLGEYRGAIKIYKDNTITEIPILLIVWPRAQFQAIIDAPDKVNKSEWFKIKINLKNIEDSPVYGVKIRVNKNKSNVTGLNFSEVEKGTNISLLSKGTEFSTEWWIRANGTGWQTIGIDIDSNNAENQTIITKINITSGDSGKG